MSNVKYTHAMPSGKLGGAVTVESFDDVLELSQGVVTPAMAEAVERAAWEAEQERIAEVAAITESVTFACAGAPFVTEECPGEGLMFFSQPSGPTLKGIPHTSVLLVPNGQCGIITEKLVTPAMKAAIEDVACEHSGNVEAWNDDSMRALHAAVERWLRTQWAIGRIRRAEDGTWDLLPAVRAT